MAVTVAEGVVVVTADGTKIPRKIAKDIQDNDGPIRRTGRSSGEGWISQFKGSFFGNLLADAVGYAASQIKDAFTAAVGFIWDGINLAGGLEQSTGGVEAVFGAMAETIKQAAAGSAQSVGLSTNAYNELASVLGSQLKNGGTAIDDIAGKTQNLIGLGADMSALFGGTAQEAIQAVSAALRGERDPIERFGVSLNQAAIDAKAAELGFEKTGGALSLQAQQAATLALIYDQTAAAQGRFAAESDTFAGQQQRITAEFENAQTALGMALLPAMTEIFKFANENLVPVLSDLAEKVGGDLADGLEKSLPYLVDLAEEILPKIPELIESASKYVPILIDALIEFGPVAIDIFGKFALGAEQISDFFEVAGERFAIGAEQWGDFFGMVGDWIGTVNERFIIGADQIVSFFETVGERFALGAEQWGAFFGAVGGWFQGFADNLDRGQQQVFGFFAEVGRRFQMGGQQISDFVSVVGQKIGEAVGFVGSLPGKIGEAVSGAGQWLYNSGKALIQGFINGIGDMFGAVGDAVGGVVDFVAGFFPNSPAKRGPLSGQGWTQLGNSGKAILEQFSSGLQGDRLDVPLNLLMGGTAAGSGGSRPAPAVAAPAARRAGSSGEINVTINESTDPLGSAGRVAAELRRWGKR